MGILGGELGGNQTVGGSFSCKFHSGDRGHVRPSAGEVREEENIKIALSFDRQGPKVVNTDGYSEVFGQGDGECRPVDCLVRDFTTHKTVSHPPFGADFHNNP